MRYILYILLFIASACTSQVHDYNIKIDQPSKDPDSIYALLTGNTGAFAGRGRFTSLPILAGLIEPFLNISSGIDDVLAEAQQLTVYRQIDVFESGLRINSTYPFYPYGIDWNVGNTTLTVGDASGTYSNLVFDENAYFDNAAHDTKLGINQPTPTEALDVVGNGLFSGTLTASNLSGTNTGDQTNIFNEPIIANGVLDYHGFNLQISNIEQLSFNANSSLVFGCEGDLEVYSNGEDQYILLDATTGAEVVVGGLKVVLNSSGGNVEIPTLDTSTGAEDSWVVIDDATGKLYRKSLAATTATLGSGVTTYAITRNVTTLTGHASGNTLATITGGISGQIITLIFADALITITDDASGTASTVNLSSAFTSTANDVLTLVHDGTSWREVSRSTN